MRRRNVACSPCSGGSSSGDCCGIKEKLRILWDRTIGSILRINGISPDGDGDFTIEAGDNIQLTERGTGNGIRIDTTGGVSYYSSGDSYVNVDNNDLEITVNVGTGGLATDADLQTVAGAVADILDGTTTIPNASNATTAGTADALALAGMDTTPTNGSNKAVTSDGILTALNNKQNIISVTKGTLGPVNIPNGGSADIGSVNITSGKFLILGKFSSSGYNSAGGYFVKINNTTVNTCPFISGLTPVASSFIYVDTPYGGSVPFNVANYGGSTIPFSVDYTIIKLE